MSRQYGDDVAVSGSLGVALAPEHGLSFEELYPKADQALYAAKQCGKNNFMIFGDNSALCPTPQPIPSTVRKEESTHERVGNIKRTLLIVDDQELNRALLCELFSEDYRLLEAEDGQTALALLKNSEQAISAVLLDLYMPGMSGLAVLEQIGADSFLDTIPVVVISAAEENEFSLRAIELGAVDFVSKPIDPHLVRLRVRNAILRRESEELRAQNRDLLVQKSDEHRHQKQLRYLAEHDTITQIWNRTAFYRLTREMLEAHAETDFSLFVFDIEHFQVINELFGHETGDALLRFIASRLQDLVKSGSFCHLDTDHFAFCVAYEPYPVHALIEQLSRDLEGYDLPFPVRLAFGAYVIDDRTLSVRRMCDRAEMARRSVRPNLLKQHIAFYDDTIRNRLLEEQQIVSEMHTALKEEQFEVYLQPKCRLSNGQTVGAEALVRWHHPKHGLLEPASFLPIFEKNGFVLQLDAFVWEKVCLMQREWLDGGFQALPISVNLSHASLCRSDLCDSLQAACLRYRLPVSLLELEVAESAYAENAKALLDAASELRSLGFSVQLDDFGRDDSSLTMLKEIPADTLKLDLRFLLAQPEDPRSRSIVSCLIDMARRLSLRIVAVGVENEEQVRFLSSCGCDVTQGFCYAKPMPRDRFGERLSPAEPGGKPRADKKTSLSCDL